MVLAMDLALTMKLPALCHFPICSKQCRRLYHGDDTAVFLPNNFLSSFVAECVVYSYDELIRDRQSCFEEEKRVRRYMFSNFFSKQNLSFATLFSFFLFLCYWYMWIIFLRRCFTPSGPHASTSSTWEEAPWGSNRPGTEDLQHHGPCANTKKKHERTQQVNRLTDKLQLGKWWKYKELVRKHPQSQTRCQESDWWNSLQWLEELGDRAEEAEVGKHVFNCDIFS